MSFDNDDREDEEMWVEIFSREGLEQFISELNTELDEIGTMEELYEHVSFANFVFENTADIMYSVEEGSLVASKSKRLMGKLKNWLAKLRSKVQTIAQNHGAESYTVTVGAPFTVSVSVTFDTSAGISTP